MTFISRVLGYLRDMVIAISLGASGTTDAFFVAFRIPNLLRRLFAEGAFSQAFVPVFSEIKMRREQSELKDLIDHVAGSLGMTLILITGLGVLAAPQIASLFAPGFIGDASRFGLTVDMLRITFPYLLFISLTAMAGGILNAMGHFAVPAFTPVLLNLSMIGTALWLAPRMETPVTALAWGVLLAGIAQLLFQLPFLHRLHLLPRPRFCRTHKGVRRILRLMLPTIFGSSVMQINLLLDTLIASLLSSGSISWLYYSDRFVELPLALFGITISTVILPRLSSQHAAHSSEQFTQTLDWALRLSLLVIIPATLGLIMLSGPILITLIQYRAFSYADTQMAVLSLMAYACGLPGFVFIKVLTPAFYSRQDTKTPVRIGMIAIATNIGCNLLYVLPWIYYEFAGPHAGLALATATSAFVNAGLLYWQLCRKGVYLPQAGWAKLIRQVSLAGGLLTLSLLMTMPSLAIWNQWSAAMRSIMLVGLISLGSTVYIGSLLVQGVRPRQFLFG